MDAEIERMVQQYNEVVDAYRHGRIDETQAATGIGNLVAVDQAGAAWTMTLEGKFLAARIGEVPREADPRQFVGDGQLDGPETQVPRH